MSDIKSPFNCAGQERLESIFKRHNIADQIATEFGPQKMKAGSESMKMDGKIHGSFLMGVAFLTHTGTPKNQDRLACRG